MMQLLGYTKTVRKTKQFLKEGLFIEGWTPELSHQEELRNRHSCLERAS